MKYVLVLLTLLVLGGCAGPACPAAVRWRFNRGWACMMRGPEFVAREDARLTYPP